MRRFWKLRKVYIPQIAALIFIAVFAARATQAGTGGKILTAEITDKYGDKVTVKTNSPQLYIEDIQAPESPAAAAVQAVSPPGRRLPPQTQQYEKAVQAALTRMSLTSETVRQWVAQHPKSTLKEIEKMSPAKQAKVANIATFIRSVNGKVDKKTAWREAAAIVYYCAKYDLSTELAVGVAKTESNFNPSLTSHAGAQGVMQVMWKYHSGMLQAKGIAATKEQMLDPERGIEAGVLLLSRYVGAYGSIQKALGRYYGKVSAVYVKKIDQNVAMLEKHSSKTGF